MARSCALLELCIASARAAARREARPQLVERPHARAQPLDEAASHMSGCRTSRSASRSLVPNSVPSMRRSCGSSRRSAIDASEPRQHRSRKCSSARSGSGEAIASSRKRRRQARRRRAPACRRRPRRRGTRRRAARRSSSRAIAQRIEQPRRLQVRLGAAARPASRRSPRPPRACAAPRRRRPPESANPSPRAKRARAPRRRPAAGGAARPSRPAPGARAAARTGRRRAASAPRDRRAAPPRTSRGKRARRVALAQIGPLAGVQQLQRLHHHLDVADAARAELDVEARLAQRPARVGRIAEQRPQPAHLVDHARRRRCADR